MSLSSRPPPPRRSLLVAVALSAFTLLLFWHYMYSYGGLTSVPIIGDKPMEKTGLGSPPPAPPTQASPGAGQDDSKSRPGSDTGRVASSSTSTAFPSATTGITGSEGAMKASPGVGDAPEVTLRQGTYIGGTLASSAQYRRTVEVFRGIPYAQSTAGQNRFRPPVPLPEGNDTFDAVAFGQICPNAYPRTDRAEGEDCLNLNLYRPAGLDYSDVEGAKALRMPVVVYIHGGSFNSGSGVERNMGSFVAWTDDNLIGISFNYRVGALGFLPSSLTAREGLLNLGLRDQQMLLRWVQENIHVFGGDPDNVTIMGLSAGAHSVGHQLMYYYQTPGHVPFAKAIIESGATTARSVFYPTHPRHLIQFREFLIAAGIEGVAEEDIFDQLRSLPLARVVGASRTVWRAYEKSVTWPFQPVIDGPNPLANSSQPRLEANGTSQPANPVIPDLPIRSWKKGAHLRVPVLTGFNTNEGAIFIPSNANTNDEFRYFFKTLIPSFTEADFDALEALYPDPVTDPKSPYRTVPAGKGKQWARLDAAYSHYAYICPVLQTAHFLSTSLDESKEDAPVYVYHFAATAVSGASNHGDEVPLVVYDTNVVGSKDTPGLRATAELMHGAWVRFAASGDPNPLFGARDKTESAPVWPVFKSSFSRDAAAGTSVRARATSELKGQVALFGEGNDERRGKNGRKNPGVSMQVARLSDFDHKACEFWWSRAELSEGVGKPREQLRREAPRAKL